MRSYDDIEAALFARNNDDPPHYHKNDPINGKKPKYTVKDPNPPPKYRQKDPNVPNREKLERNGGPSRGHGNEVDCLSHFRQYGVRQSVGRT